MAEVGTRSQWNMTSLSSGAGPAGLSAAIRLTTGPPTCNVVVAGK